MSPPFKHFFSFQLNLYIILSDSDSLSLRLWFDPELSSLAASVPVSESGDDTAR